MSNHSNRKRSIRARVLAVCVFALLALPAGASAMLPPDDSAPAVHHGSESVVITRDGGQTLAIVLSAAALAVAATGTAYVALRVRPLLARRS